MCGILGFAGERRDWGRPQLEAMARLLAHRGPDGEGFHLASGVGLGHRRLALLDLDTGAQPMKSPCGDLWITFNGEIYNFRELRRDLESRGHRFTTRSDTEAILHLYEEEGEACVHRLRGMFAFAIWDAGRRRLFAARDRLGVKPFAYWASPDGGSLAFASELKALLCLPGVPREPDPEAIRLFLGLQYVPPPRTGFLGIRKLPPGHTLLFEPGRLEVRRYWRLEAPASPSDPAELLDRLDEAVRIRLVSDVPLGALLSGGVDSSAVASSMALQSGCVVAAFTLGSEEPGFDETAHARTVARRWRLDSVLETVRPDALSILPRLSWHFDEPFADASAIPTLLVSALARTRVKAVLSGDGGDEAFLGYPRYRADLLASLLRPFRALLSPLGRLPGEDEKALGRRARRFLEGLEEPDRLRRYARWVTLFPARHLEALGAPPGPSAEDWLAEEARATGFPDGPERLGALDAATYLPGALLPKVDLASMAVGLECRSPFLDTEFLAWAAGVPWPRKLDLLSGKICLRTALRSRLPASVLDRPKMGFGVPVGRWFRGPLQPLLRERLLSPGARIRGFLRPEGVASLVEDHVAGRAFHGYRLWALLMLEGWLGTWASGPLPQKP